MPPSMIQPIVILALWLILVGLKKGRTKKGDLDIVLFVTVLAAFILFDVLALADLPVLIVEVAIMVGVFYTALTMDLKALIKKDYSKSKLKQLKQDFEELQDRSELLRQRFITILDLYEDGIAFRTDDDMIFGTEVFIKLMGFKEHEFSFQAFLKKMHPDDQASYLEMIEKASKKRPKYTVHYRIKKGDEYVWIKEVGTLLLYQKRVMFISLAKGLDVKKYPTSNVAVLNGLAIDKAYYEAIQALNKKRDAYTIVTFEITNIPRINEKYGRDVGDLMMGEFLSKLAYHFLKDINAVFRLSGIRFAMLITDKRKVEILKRALKEGGDLINYHMEFGQAKESVYPSFVIHHVDVYDEPVDAIAERALKALDIALDENTPENYFIIR